jgi:pantothenate synthetase
MTDPLGSPNTTPHVPEDVPGVAFNSRLRLLSPAERSAVGAIYRALRVIVKTYLDDEFSAAELVLRGTLTLQVERLLRVNYVRIAHPFGLQDIEEVDPVIGAIAIVCVSVNGVVNISDNVILAPNIPRRQRSFWGLVRSARHT